MKLATVILSVLAISSCSLATDAATTRTKDLENTAPAQESESSRHLRKEKKKGEKKKKGEETRTPPTGPAKRIVTFNSKEDRAAFLEANPDLTIHNVFKRGASIVITLTQEEALVMLENEAVKSIEFDDIVQLEPIKPDPTDTPKGTASTAQSETVPYGITMVKALEVDDSNIGTMTLCIADSGYDLGHEDLQTTNVSGQSFVGENWYEDGRGHGTHVAGTIAALENDKGVLGVVRNGNLNLLIAQVCSKRGYCPSSAILDGFEWCADNGANVISASLGGAGYSQAFDDLTKEIYEEDGVLIVAASGNTGANHHFYPASYDSVMSVAAVDSNKNWPGFNTYNSQVEMAAPGVDVLSTYPNNCYYATSGTSMACPHVSAIAALIWSHFPSKSASDVRQALQATAEDLGTGIGLVGRDDYTGYGLVNAKAAFDLLEEMTLSPTTSLSPTSAPTTSLSPTSAPTQCNGSTLQIEALTDYYTSEIAWTVKNVITGEVIFDIDYYESKFYSIHEACIPECSGGSDLYMFRVWDSSGNGGLEYTIKIDGIEIVSSGPYTYANTEIVQFSPCGKVMQLIPSNNPTQALTPEPIEETDLEPNSRKLSKATKKTPKAPKAPKAPKSGPKLMLTDNELTLTLAQTPKAPKAPKAPKSGPKLILTDNEFSMEQIWYYTHESYLMNVGLGMCLQGDKGGSLFLSDCEFDIYDPSKSFILGGFYDAVVSTLGRKPAAITLENESSVMLKEFLGPDAEGEPLKFEWDLSSLVMIE